MDTILSSIVGKSFSFRNGIDVRQMLLNIAIISECNPHKVVRWLSDGIKALTWLVTPDSGHQNIIITNENRKLSVYDCYLKLPLYLQFTFTYSQPPTNTPTTSDG